jgi:hypothetical protein
MIRKYFLVLSALVCLLALPAAARAQSAIAGVVKDSSGAVLPGVTVEAASDVLIEKSKVAVTDGAGAYKIVDLRPGTYLVTFTLTGFATVKHENIELPSDFTATIDAAMKVGTLEESITVSTASPVVDVQSNVKSQVLSRDTLDAIPNAHTLQSIGQLIPGVTLSSPDVGGSVQMQQTYFSVHGTGANGTSMLMDGMIINGLMLDGAVQTYMNDATAQEMVYRTGGGGGEQQTGGLQINVVPREGGNKFSGQLSMGFENWQSNNFGQELKDVGVTSVDKLGSYHDISATEGGPVKKDRLWWFASGRLSLEKKPVANSTNSAGFNGDQIDSVLTNSGLSTQVLAACRAAAASGACPQGVSGETVNSGNARITLQVNSKNKLGLYYDRIHKDRASDQGALADERITGVHWNSPNYSTMAAKWTSTISNKLLIQGGWSSNIERYNNIYQAGLEQPLYGPLWASMATRVQDSTLRSVTSGPEYGSYPDRYNWQGSASYVTGSHNMQLGFQDSFGTYNQRYYANGDSTSNFTTNSSGVVAGSGITPYTTSPFYDDRLNAGLGIYAQDNWTMKRLTLNYGLRWDYLLESVVGENAEQGTFVDIAAYGNRNMPTQTNWEPHVSVIYDVFGNGKTAVRAGYNRYVNGATTTLAASQDPTAVNLTVGNATWIDANGDGIPQYQVTHNAAGQLVQTCVYQTPGCEVNIAGVTGLSSVGSVNTTLQDPNLKRPSQDKFNVGISHEVFKGVSLSFEYFHTTNSNIQQTFNTTRLQACGGITPPTAAGGITAADASTLVNCNLALSPAQIAANPQFQLINVFSPIDGHTVPVYDLANSTVNAFGTNNFVTTDPKQTSVYNGFDVGFNARLPHGGRMFGGTTTERQLNNNCDTAIQSPNSLLYCDQAALGDGTSIPWKTQIKLAATYPLPFWGLIINGSYQGLPGYTLGNTTYSIVKGSTRYTVCPGTSAAAGCVATAPTSTSTLVAPTAVNSLSAVLQLGATDLTPRNNQVDFGIAKRLKIGRVRIDPKVDMFNALNSDDYYSVTSTAFTPIALTAGQPTNVAASPTLTNGFTTFLQPGRFLQGRIFRLGANITW